MENKSKVEKKPTQRTQLHRMEVGDGWLPTDASDNTRNYFWGILCSPHYWAKVWSIMNMSTYLFVILGLYQHHLYPQYPQYSHLFHFSFVQFQQPFQRYVYLYCITFHVLLFVLSTMEPVQLRWLEPYLSPFPWQWHLPLTISTGSLFSSQFWVEWGLA